MISASIVLYKNKVNEITELLISVSKIDEVSQIYIVDNSPINDLKTIADLPKVQYIFGHGNVGYGSGHNIAIRKSIERGYKYHMVLNPDIYVDEKTIVELKNYLNRHLDVGQVMPKVLYPNGDLQYLCKLFPTPLDLFFRRFLPKTLFKKKRNLYQLEFTGYNREINCPTLSGCFMFLRIEALKRVGLFDERFFMYGEDFDLCRRMHQCYKTMYYPNVSIIHAHEAASYKSFRMLKVHCINMCRYFNKWGWFFDKERREVNKATLKELRQE